jgi:hypothetical protein
VATGKLSVVAIATTLSILRMLSVLVVVRRFAEGAMRTVISPVRIVGMLCILTNLTVMTTGAIVAVVVGMRVISLLPVFGIVPVV